MKITISKEDAFTKVTVSTPNKRHTEKGLNVKDSGATLLGDALNALDIPDVPKMEGGEDLPSVLNHMTDAGYDITEMSITMDK